MIISNCRIYGDIQRLYNLLPSGSAICNCIIEVDNTATTLIEGGLIDVNGTMTEEEIKNNPDVNYYKGELKRSIRI